MATSHLIKEHLLILTKPDQFKQLAFKPYVVGVYGVVHSDVLNTQLAILNDERNLMLVASLICPTLYYQSEKYLIDGKVVIVIAFTMEIGRTEAFPISFTGLAYSVI